MLGVILTLPQQEKFLGCGYINLMEQGQTSQAAYSSYHRLKRQREEEDFLCDRETKRFKQTDAGQQNQTSSIPPEIWTMITKTL